MAVTKILARKGGLNGAINYILNGDKTEEQTLVAAQYCSPETAPEEMRRTKEQWLREQLEKKEVHHELF